MVKNKWGLFQNRWSLFFLSITAILLFIFLLEFKIVGQAVYGDGRYYLGFARSIYFDQNIDITDELAHHWSPESNNQPADSSPVPSLRDAIKVTTYNFSLGISIIWLPFFALGDIFVLTFSNLGLPFVRNGYSDIYQITLAVGNISFVVGGLFVLSKLLLKQFTFRITALSLVLILFATNLLYYAGLDVNNSHPFSFFAASMLLYLFIKYREKPQTLNILLQGLILGLMIANRTQDAIFSLIPLVSLLSNTKIPQKKLSKNLKSIAMLALGFALGYLPQLIILYLGQERFLLSAHLASKSNDIWPLMYTLSVLFDKKLGVFYYIPILIPAFFGLLLYRNRFKTIGALMLAVFLLNFLLISSYEAWSTAGYSIRYFISILPIFVFGIAEALKYLSKKFSFTLIYVLSGLFIIHEFFAIAVFKLFLQDPTYINGQLTRSGELKIFILQTIQQTLSNF